MFYCNPLIVYEKIILGLYSYDDCGEILKGEEGQVGVGTLIVFIAMVLVAAIAAAVLINTSDLLQRTAQSVGKQAVLQTSSGVDIKTIEGHVTTISNVNYVDFINFTVKLRPGSDGLDLGNTTIHYIDDSSDAILTCNISSSGSQTISDPSNVSWSTTFVVTWINDDDTSLKTSGNGNPVLNSRIDIAKVYLNVSAIRGDNGIREDKEAKIRIIPPLGVTTSVSVYIPISISGKTRVSLS